MDLEELLYRKYYREKLEWFADEDFVQLSISCDDMSDSEKTSFIQFLVAESRKKDQQISRLQKTIENLSAGQYNMQLTLDTIQKKQCGTCDNNVKLHFQLVAQGAHLKFIQSALKKTFVEADKYRSLYKVFCDEIEPNFWIYGMLVDNKREQLRQYKADGFGCSGVHLSNSYYSVFGDQEQFLGVTEFYNIFLTIPYGWWM